MFTSSSAFLVRLCTLTICIILTPLGFAHIYAGDSDQYIRIVQHPELQDYYSYGVCNKNNYQTDAFARGVPIEQITSANHLHADCVVPEGKYWWHLPNPENYVPVAGKAPNLLDVLQWDDKGRGYLNTFELASYVLGFKVATKVTSMVFKKTAAHRKFHIRAMRTLGKFFLDATVDGVVTMGFWEAGRALSDKIDHDHYRKTQPFTEYKNWINETVGVNQAGIQVDNIGQLRIPKPFIVPQDQSCMDHCYENAFEIRNRLSNWYDKYSTLGLNKFANLPEDPNIAQQWLVYRSYPSVCQLRCEQNYKMPTLAEMWALQSALLAQANPNELHRVLFDHSAPWEDSDWKITYMTPQLISKHMGQPRWGGSCLIGSACDQKYEMVQPHLASLDHRKYKKISIQNLKKNYSKNVSSSLVSASHDHTRFHHFGQQNTEQLANDALPQQTDDLNKLKAKHVYPMGSMLIFGEHVDMENIQIFNAYKKEVFMDEYTQYEDRTLDISHIIEPGIYYILLPLDYENRTIVHKVVVGKQSDTN